MGRRLARLTALLRAARGASETGAHDPSRVIDADVDLNDPVQARETRPRQWDILAAVSLGGIAGAEARYGLSVAMPHSAATFPWSTVLVNASGCLLIGVLMVFLLELTDPHRLVRPFLAVGVLGGYTTYSTFAGDAVQLVHAGRAWIAVSYVAVTMVSCLAAVYAAALVTRIIGHAVLDRDVRRVERES